jgi:hypothetical protein
MLRRIQADAALIIFGVIREGCCRGCLLCHLLSCQLRCCQRCLQLRRFLSVAQAQALPPLSLLRQPALRIFLLPAPGTRQASQGGSCSGVHIYHMSAVNRGMPPC